MRHVAEYNCLPLQKVLEQLVGDITEVLPVIQESGTKQIYCRSGGKTVLIVTVTDDRCTMDTNNFHGVKLQFNIERLRDAIEACEIDWASGELKRGGA